VGSPQIRAAGSVGGNLGTCSPAGDSLPVLSALDATIHIVSASGNRDVTFSEFMVGPKKNSLRPGELISAVSMPVQRGRQGYAKVGVRNAMVISVASACFAFQDGTVRLALGSVGPTIIRCSSAEQFANGAIDRAGKFDRDSARRFGELAAGESRPIDDHRSTAAYRRHAIGVLAERLALRGTQQ
jgi:CO/xanthine dehydrogenase FAD-binding subunit